MKKKQEPPIDLGKPCSFELSIQTEYGPIDVKVTAPLVMSESGITNLADALSAAILDAANKAWTPEHLRGRGRKSGKPVTSDTDMRGKLEAIFAAVNKIGPGCTRADVIKELELDGVLTTQNAHREINDVLRRFGLIWSSD